MRTFGLYYLIVALTISWPVQAQRAALLGTVVDSITGDPLEGVVVTLVDLDIATVTDSRGSFQFFGLRSGIHTVTVRHVGYQPLAIRFQLNAEHQTEVTLGTLHLARTSATELDPIEIEAVMVQQYPQLEAFFRRMRTEQGTFLTEADIQREAPLVTSDLVRKLPGFRTNEFGEVVTTRGSPRMGFTACRVQYFINGIESHASSINVVLPNIIVGMEIYSGMATIPPIYRKGRDGHCGVIAIWTRHTRRPERP